MSHNKEGNVRNQRRLHASKEVVALADFVQKDDCVHIFTIYWDIPNSGNPWNRFLLVIMIALTIMEM